MEVYKALNKQIYTTGAYRLVPIRMEDRYDIMKWRNEQIYHLRQIEPLTKAKQDAYFEEVVCALFKQAHPNQLLFSFLKGSVCIGYGGLVHINWIDRLAEVSFIMKTELEKNHFQENWQIFLGLLEEVAFEELKLHKLYTYAFDVRPKLYAGLEKAGFKREATLPEHCCFNGRFMSVVIHGKINRKVALREATISDVDTTFQWANDSEVRRFALTQGEISRDDHANWFKRKIENADCLYYIATYDQEIVGSFRLDINTESEGVISYLLDPQYHGMGLGKSLLVEGIKKAQACEAVAGVIGYVKTKNEVSAHLFRKLGFMEKVEKEGLLKFELSIK